MENHKMDNKTGSKLPQFSIEYSISEDDWDREEMEPFSGTYDFVGFDGLFFDQVATQVVTAAMERSLARLAPLFQDVKIGYFNVALDIRAIEDPNVYSLIYPNRQDGIMALLLIGPELIEELLKARWSPSFQLSDFHEYALDYELLHVLDNAHVNVGKLRYQTENLYAVFVSWLIGFRTEGLANLGLFLRGYGGEHSFDKARTYIATRIRKLFSNSLEMKERLRRNKFELNENDNEFHEYGPMMMLHAIYCFAKTKKDQETMDLAEKALGSELLDDAEINSLIGVALKINFQDFIIGLTQRGPMKKVFLSSGKIKSLLLRYQHVYYFDQEYFHAKIFAEAQSVYFEKLESEISFYASGNISVEEYEEHEIEICEDEKDNEEGLLSLGEALIDILKTH